MNPFGFLMFLVGMKETSTTYGFNNKCTVSNQVIRHSQVSKLKAPVFMKNLNMEEINE